MAPSKPTEQVTPDTPGLQVRTLNLETPSVLNRESQRYLALSSEGSESPK